MSQEFVAGGPTEVVRVTAPEAPPAVVESRFAGRLEFTPGGFPTDQTVAGLYDQLDFQRGCQVFLRHIMAAAIWGFQQAFRRDIEVGPMDLAIFHLDANGLLLTGNSETVYGITILDTKTGPVVLDLPPQVLGLLNDQWMRPVADLGLAGPDHGAGGAYLLLPPGYDGPEIDGDHVQTISLQTYRQWLVLRAFMGPGGDPEPGKDTLRQLAIHPPGQPSATRHVDASGKAFDTIHPTDIRYFEDLAEIINYEPADAISPEERAQLAQIGIRKGQPFAPDDRLRAILQDAAQVASFTAFAISNAPREKYTKYTDRHWYGIVAGYPSFIDEQGLPMIDEMVQMAWFGTGRAQAMGSVTPGVGSAYTWEYRDANGDWIDPRRTYRLRLPGPIPAKNFWSVVVYDLWTRSMLANGQAYPSLNSYTKGIALNDDDGADIYIGPEPPDDDLSGNWIRTLPDIGWFPLLRLYGPLEPWIDNSWKPDDLTPMD